ncbi:hypothetical protein Cob_v001661 [Colletotrichum orbiculare MAFF 240422]|uniref:DUF7896 domain-containing protein n=1 Tax=Colletotrichum orbiculare (strain 104-T / ATCC 96160 / CBS 514.97 / LARS 414 / MAFF 240422) TaxID=1213857 RepID=N4VG09_COLOR|nr:hypothetical protein Cob_v001661 [Colletotrichum orbiculare MAFF 240422]
MTQPYNPQYQELQFQVLQKQQELQSLQLQLSQHQPAVSAAPPDFLASQPDFYADLAICQPQLPNVVPAVRKSTMPRSKSNIGYSSAVPTRVMERSNDVDSPQPMKRPRVMSQQAPRAAPMMAAMSRSTSSRADKSNPFVAKGPLAPLQTSNTPNAMLDRFYQSNDDPHVLFQPTLQRTPSSRRQSNLQRVEENMPLLHGVGMNPADYLARHDENLPSPAMVPPQPSFLTASDGRNSQASLGASVCPSMSSGTSAPETTPLTRENSTFDNRFDNQSLSGAFEMARLNSTQSQFADFPPDLGLVAPAISPNMKSETYLAHVGAGANMFPQQSPLEDNFFSQSMERSISSTSTASNKSNQERRANHVFQQQINNATKTSILPKPQDDSKPSQSPTAKKEPKVPVAKGTYTRPKHPKVYCDRCTDHPDGFRGDHELRRHMSAKHEGTIKKFICRDPSKAGLKGSVDAIIPLSKCKQCIAGKHYGAYYNAAAHLRRAHFKPKLPRGKKGRGDDDEKRGGKGGGDWPPMSELKLWMEEVFVIADDVEGGEDDSPEDDDEEVMQLDPLALDVSLGHMGENMSYDNMSFATPYPMPELVIDTHASSYLAMSNMPPLSSASEVFTFSPFASNSPMGFSHDTAFSISSSNTVTPTTYQDTLAAGSFDGYSY